MTIDRSERVDVRIPEKTYKKIERIAEKTNQPFTPKSKNTKNPKRIVTPIILELLELGLSVYGKKQLELTEAEFEDVNLTNLENKILSRLEVTIKDLVTKQVSEAILQYEHMSKVFDEIDLEFAVNQLSELTEADNEDTSEIINEDVSELLDKSPNALPEFYRIKSNLCNLKGIISGEEVAKAFECTIEQIENKDLSETKLKILQYVKKRDDGFYDNRVYEILIYKEEDITPEIEDSEDNSEPNLLPKEIKSEDTEDKEQGLSMGKLAERFKTNKNEGKGASKTTISSNVKKLSKEEFIHWSKENDPENKGWYLNEADNKFYPVD